MRADADQQCRGRAKKVHGPTEPAAAGEHVDTADRHGDEPAGQEGRCHPGRDRQWAGQRIGENRGPEQDDEQAEQRRPGIAGRYGDDRPADNHRGDRCQGEVHGAAV